MKSIFIITVIVNMFLTTNAQWREVDSPTSKEITDIHFVDAENGFMSCASGTVLKTTNGGLDWQAFDTGISASFMSIFGIDKDTVYTARVSLYKSTNSCVSWSDYGGLGSSGSTIFDIHFLSSKTGFIIKSGKLYKTNDYGLNWYKVYDNVYSNGNIIFTSQDTGYVVGGGRIRCDPGPCNFPFNYGAIIKTTDGGESWQKLNFFNDTLNIISASFINNNFGYCFSSNNTIQKTEDGGLTWLSINTGITGNISGGLFINKDIGFIITIGQIYITTNGGINWDLEYTVSDGGLFELGRSNKMVVAGGAKGLICVRNLDNLNLFTDDMLWSTIKGTNCDLDDSDCRSYYTKIAHDTIINEVLYKRIMNSTDALMNKWDDAGFIREAGQQVFYRSKNSDTECLLYDFSCSVGDILNLDCSCIYESKFKVDSIKYLPVMGHTRKHIYLSYLENSSTECWIEGIGSLSGILNGGGAGNCATGFHERLLCCSKNDEIIYKDPDFDTCFLQSGSSFATPGKKWVSLLLSYPVGTVSNRICYQLGSDTTIAEMNYYKLLEFYGCKETHTTKGYLRETDDQLVYFRPPDSDQEFLLYDFGMSVGDSTYMEWFDGYYRLDSTGISDEGKKIYYMTDPQGNLDAWIEGVGSVDGLLKEFFVGEEIVFTCCILDENLLYKNPHYETCFSATGSNMADGYPEKNSSLMIFPNPANNEITIRTTSNDRIQSVELISLKGKSVLKQAEIDKTEYQVLIGHLPKGAYILNVKTKGELKNHRIIIQ